MLDVNSRVDQGPTTTAERIRAKLLEYSRDGYDSPLVPYAQTIYDLGVQYGVDPALWMAICRFENAFGMYPSNGAWDPVTQSGSFNWCSISNAYYGGWPVPGSRWGQYPDIRTGIEAFYKLITIEYYGWNNQRTIGQIIWGVGGTANCTGSHAYGPTCGIVGTCYPCTEPGNNIENQPGYAQTVVDFMNSIAAAAPPGPPPIWVLASPGVLVILGGMMIFGAALLWQYMRMRPGGV
mgnify:CR=1 FL=1